MIEIHRTRYCPCIVLLGGSLWQRKCRRTDVVSAATCTTLEKRESAGDYEEGNEPRTVMIFSPTIFNIRDEPGIQFPKVLDDVWHRLGKVRKDYPT